MNPSLLLVALATATLIPVSACATASQRPSADQVLAELSRRSALPPGKLKPLLANCDADQQSMYFCACRDVVAADLTLKLMVAEKGRESTACRSSLDTLVANFERSREPACAKSSAETFGGGSMEHTAQVICVAASTNSMVEQVRATECR